jgi:hypothetical protein
MRQMVRLFAAPRGEANFVALLEKVAAREARP